MKNCIISFANQRGRYVKNMARLSESLRDNFDGDFLGFVHENSIGAPNHLENPYAFKIYCFQKALEQGYKKILYLDSSAFAVRNVQPCFDEIEKHGFLVQMAGHMLGTWCNDNGLAYLGITREQANKMPMIGNAGMMGLDFDKPQPVEFFNRWRASMEAGAFKGSWDNHRHDMSMSSGILNLMGIVPKLAKPGDQWLQYAGIFDATLNDTIIFKAQG